MFGKKKEVKKDNKKLKEIALDASIEEAGLTGLLDENSLKLFKRVKNSKRGVGLSETSGFFGSSEKQNLLTIVSQNIVIKEQNDMIIQLLAQIAKNTKPNEEITDDQKEG